MTNNFVSTITAPATRTARRAAFGFAVAALAVSLVGCAGGPAENTSTTDTSSHSEQGSHGPITIKDAWVKATSPDAKPGEAMSGVFGTLENSGSKDLTITGVESDAAGMVELHEVVDGEMRKIQGDVVIPAGGSFELAPGANHIMLMEIPKPLLPGSDVTVTVKLSDGSSFEFTALVKDTRGANENYNDADGEGHGDEHSGHGSH